MNWHKKTYFYSWNLGLHKYNYKLILNRNFLWKARLDNGYFNGCFGNFSAWKRAGGGKSHGMARSTTSNINNLVKWLQFNNLLQHLWSGCGFNGCGWCSWCCRSAAHALADDKPTSTEQRVKTISNKLLNNKRRKVVSQMGITCCCCCLFCISQIWRKLAANNPYAPNSNGQNTFRLRQLTQTTTPIFLVSRRYSCNSGSVWWCNNK